MLNIMYFYCLFNIILNYFKLFIKLFSILCTYSGINSLLFSYQLSKKNSYALFAIALVSRKSTAPPTPAPTKGTALPRLITPFDPNFVTNLNPIS